jgi:2-oxoglutarate dehydrogenase E2 component (dihydrolipoamide succinyltransferase)
MATKIEIKVPVLPESVADATVSVWHVKPGDAVKRDQNLVDIETDKVMLEVPAPVDGVIQDILQAAGSIVNAQQVIATLTPGTSAAVAPAAEANPTAKANVPALAPAAEVNPTAKSGMPAPAAPIPFSIDNPQSPSARRFAAENEVNLQQIAGSGKGGRVTKEDILNIGNQNQGQNQAQSVPSRTPSASTPGFLSEGRSEQRVPMTRLRARIAERLVSAKQTAAILTTFNEVNLKTVMELRQHYKDAFEKKHGVKLGLMSFFTQATVEALKQFPVVNASIDGNDIVYHNYYDIGVAVSTERGLVVPILRDADKMNFADVERRIAEYGKKARDGQLTMEEITGGTFTITNGGIFGSLLSTPIINPPQAAILGMHKIEERPVVENGQVVIRPMMYIALSYDHRLIDGKDSVQFLLAVKQFLEVPARMLLDL